MAEFEHGMLQPMEIETDHTENRPGTDQQIAQVDIFDERSRSPILTQRSDRDIQPPDVNNVPLQSVSADVDVKVLENESDSNTCECTCNKEKKLKAPNEDYEDEDDGKLCPICFDIWATSGEHRVCALKCGHLFGYSCLERWLRGQRSCPTCKRTVKKADIRYIYAKKLIALDTVELTSIKTELERERDERNKIQIELIQTKQREESFKKEIVDLKRQIEVLKTSSRYINNSQSSIKANDLKIYKEKYFEVNKDGGCRVMDYYKSSSILVISSHTPSSVFPGFGVRKVQVNDFKSSCYIPLHSGMIRDLSFHPQKELLLSVSVDKLVRLTETANSKSVHTVQCSGPIWSCCWDATNSNFFFVGEQSGSTVKYDIRKTTEKLCSIQIPGDFSPVVSLASSVWCPGAALPQGGLFVCKLNSCTAFAESSNSEELTMHPLGLEGPFVSMRYDNTSGHLLVTSRPNLQHPFSRHTLCTITRNSGNSVVPNIVQVYQGGPVQKLLSRSCQMNIAGDVLVSAHQETNKAVDIWSLSSGKRITALSAHSPVLDLCPVPTDSANYLCALNERKVDFYKLEIS